MPSWSHSTRRPAGRRTASFCGARSGITKARSRRRDQAGTIPTAEAILDVGSEPRVLQVAETIRAGQTAEIDAMQGMRQRLTCMV
jgi:hypothetical protein